MAEKTPSLNRPVDMFVAGPTDVWYVVSDARFGSYNTEVDDPGGEAGCRGDGKSFIRMH